MNGIQGISSTSFTMNTQSINNKNRQDPFLTDAASVLGLSYDELVSQLESGKDLDTIVTEQGLTVEDFRQQMDELNPNKGQTGSIQNTPPPPPPPGGSEQFLTDAASVLGLSTDELKTLLQSGKDLETIITEQGLTTEDFQQQMSVLFNNHQSALVDQRGNIFDSVI